jgi:hypothetical protein
MHFYIINVVKFLVTISQKIFPGAPTVKVVDKSYKTYANLTSMLLHVNFFESEPYFFQSLYLS